MNEETRRRPIPSPVLTGTLDPETETSKIPDRKPPAEILEDAEIRVYSRSRRMEGGRGEQDGLSSHSLPLPLPLPAPTSSASSLPAKDHSQVELELRLLEALQIYPPVKLQGMHRHFVLYGLMEYMRRSFDRNFPADEVLQLLDRFFNLEMLKPDDEEAEALNHEEDFSLPQKFFIREDP